MKIAVSAWDERVSPVFDTSERLVMAELDGTAIKGLGESFLGGFFGPEKVERLKQLGTDALICGAISGPLARMIEAAGITLIPWVAGPVDEVLAAYVDGSLLTPRFKMPGYSAFRRRGGGGGRRLRRGCGRRNFGGP